MIPQSEPRFGVEEEQAVTAYLRSGGWLTEHTKTAQFEEAIAAFTGSAHCVVVQNGTVSLTLAALALGIRPGSEVIVPAYSMIATANAFKMIGITPVFVDVEPDTLCMDIALVARAMTHRTRAIVLMTANGRAPTAGVEIFEQMCQRRGIHLIEDAAQSLGSHFHDGRHCGTAGTVGSFSFSVPKIISTGQGGALVTDDADVAAKLRKLKDFGRTSGGNDVHESIGFNGKFTDLQAVVGLEQMKKLKGRVQRKREILQQYWRALVDVPQVHFFLTNVAYSTPWFVDVLVKDRDWLQKHLLDRDIGTRVMYSPIPHQKAYGEGGIYFVAERVGRDGLWLPSSAHLTADEVDRVCLAIKEFYQ